MEDEYEYYTESEVEADGEEEEDDDDETIKNVPIRQVRCKPSFVIPNKKWVSSRPFLGSIDFRKDSAWRKRFEAEINSTPTEV